MSHLKPPMIILLSLLFALLLSACGGDSADSNDSGGDVVQVSSGDAIAGEQQYNSVCIACHGLGGEGVEGLGKPFTSSDFIRSHSDDELLAFVKSGRPSTDPENTTGIDMPPKGGNPALSDDQILDIIAYMRSINQ